MGGCINAYHQVMRSGDYFQRSLGSFGIRGNPFLKFQTAHQSRHDDFSHYGHIIIYIADGAAGAVRLVQTVVFDKEEYDELNFKIRRSRGFRFL